MVIDPRGVMSVAIMVTRGEIEVVTMFKRGAIELFMLVNVDLGLKIPATLLLKI